ncbi:MAG: flagellin [Arcobacteraceae bacterium]|jgi:flagellin|nr:flagellin [Arcobacteraceae bacterium]
MRINTNIASLNAIESGTNNNIGTTNSLEKLSSGLRINKASDDASGLAIADKLRTQQNSIGQSINNANSAVAMIQIADKAMGEQSNILDIVKTKLIQSATATTSDEGRKALGKDINKLLNQLDSIAGQTNYNGMSLLQKSEGDANVAVSLDFQIGEKSSDLISTTGTIQSNTTGLAKSAPLDSLADLKTDTSGDGSGLTDTKSKTYLAVIDLALNDLNSFRSNLGSTQNQIESATRNMMTQKTNIAAAESVIRDIDYAQESANFNKLNIMGQGSTYAQAQANSRPNDILKLLQ